VDTGGESDEEEPEIQVYVEEAENETVRPNRPAIPLENLVLYYRGAYFATVAMKKKLEGMLLGGRTASEKIDAYQRLINEYSAAIRETPEG
jgi:hypothetical protein